MSLVSPSEYVRVAAPRAVRRGPSCRRWTAAISLGLSLLMVSCPVRFTPRVVDTYEIRLAVVAVEGDVGPVLTSADLTLIYAGELVLERRLEAGTSELELREDWERLTFVVEKARFGTCAEQLSRVELARYEDVPMVFTLEPAID